METVALAAKADLGTKSLLPRVVRIGAPDGFGSVFLAPRFRQHRDVHRLQLLGQFRHAGLRLQICGIYQTNKLQTRSVTQARLIGQSLSRAAELGG